MDLNSPVQRLRLWLFPKGFIRLQCFYLKLAGRASVFLFVFYLDVQKNKQTV